MLFPNDSLVNCGARRQALYAHVEDSGSSDGLVLAEHEPEAHPAADHAEYQRAFLVHRAEELRGNRFRTIVGVTRYIDRVAAEVFNPVMAALGFYIDYRPVRQVRAI